MPPLSALVLALQIANRASLDFSRRAVQEFATLRPGVTPAAWLATHAEDNLVLFRRDSVRENHDRWCARASRAQAVPGGTRIVRYAYFYPPAPAPSLTLPSDGREALVREHCVLGAIWIEAGPMDSTAGNSLAGSVHNAFFHAYGRVTPGPDAFVSRRPIPGRVPGMVAIGLGLHFFGAAAWRWPGRWQKDSMVIVSAFDSRFANRNEGRVLAFAYLPVSELGEFRDLTDRSDREELRSAALTAEASRLAGLDSTLTARLLATLASAESAYTGLYKIDGARVDVRAVTVLRDWVDGSRTLEPTRRAAALLAADEAVGSAGMTYVRAQRQDSGRAELQRLGATFDHDELGGSENYTHNWLAEALRLDPDGPVGRLATLAEMRRGFNDNGMCGGGNDPFRRVIKAGERLLAGTPDGPTAAELHRLVADGYADIVALAAGAGGEYADSSGYVAEATAARASAIAHYRASLVLDHATPEAGQAWLEAWRLLARLAPTTTHFFCVYD
jgi:hypothetical protein